MFEGEWHGIHRTMPIDYPGPNGTNYTLFLDVKSITDGEGNKLKYEFALRKLSRDLKIYIPNAVDTTRTVEIDYAAQRVRDFARTMTSFTGMLRATIGRCPSITLPPRCNFQRQPPDRLRAQAFTGAYGRATEGCDGKGDGAAAALRPPILCPCAAA